MSLKDFDDLTEHRKKQEGWSEVKLLENDDSVASRELAKSLRRIQNNIDLSVEGKGDYGSLGGQYVSQQVAKDYKAAIDRALQVRDRELDELRELKQKTQKEYDKSKVSEPIGTDEKIKKHRDQEQIKALAGMSDEEIEREVYSYTGDKFFRSSYEFLNELSKQTRERKLNGAHKKLRDAMQKADASNDGLRMTVDGLKLIAKEQKLKNMSENAWQVTHNGALIGIDMKYSDGNIDRLLDLAPLSKLRK